MNNLQATLRDLTEEDLDTVVLWRNDSVINKYLTGRVRNREEAQEWFGRIKSFPLNLLKAIMFDGQFIGYCSISEINAQNGNCQVGVIIGESDCWGKGVGKTAVAELISYCFKQLKFHRVLAVIAKGNERSEQLFKSMGFKHEGTLREATRVKGQFNDLLCYSILEQEYH